MAVEQLYELHLGDAGLQGRPFGEGAAATVADGIGTTILTVSRCAERGNADGVPAMPWSVLVVEGDVDQDTAPLLREALDQAVDDRAAVCCDLSGVTFFGAAAANLVLHVHLRAVAADRRFLLRGATVMTDRVLAAVDPDRILLRW